MIYVILPAYNEEAALESLIQSIIKKLGSTNCRIVVINDGSTDTTARVLDTIATEHPINIVTHDRNLGLGQALKDGFLHILPHIQDSDTIITMDSDGTHVPEYLKTLVEHSQRNHGIVIASRYARGGGEIGIPVKRSLCSRIANRLMARLFSIPGVKDYTSGFRAYAGSVIKKGYAFFREHLIVESGFTCMAEVLIKLSFLKVNIGEIPIVLRYDLKKGSSKMPVLRTVFRYLYLWVYLIKIKRSFAG